MALSVFFSVEYCGHRVKKNYADHDHNIDTCSRAERDWMRKDIYILRDVMDRQALSEAYFTTTAFIVRVYTYRAIATAHRNEHIIITSPTKRQKL